MALPPALKEHFDDIAENKLERNKMLNDFYTPFHALIEQSGGIDRSSVGESREIGTDPKTGKPIWHASADGPMLQLGSTDDKRQTSIRAASSWLLHRHRNTRTSTRNV